MNDADWIELVNDAIAGAVESRITSTRAISFELMQESLGLIEQRATASTPAERAEIDVMLGRCSDRCEVVVADFEELADELLVVLTQRGA